MLIFFLQRVAKISPALVAALDDDHAELFESPFLVARPRVKEVVVFSELPDNGGLAVLVLAVLRPFDLKEEMVGAPLFWLLRIGDGEICVGVDRRGLEILLLPVELPAVEGAEFFDGDVEVRNFKLVVESAGRVPIEGFSVVLPGGFI